MMNIYFTVDTEVSMGGALRFPERRPVTADRAIFCRIQGQDHGIGLLTRIMSEHGFRATYFVETLFARIHGDGDARAVFDYLLTHDQDVQLHMHPIYRLYSEMLEYRSAGREYRMPSKSDLLGAFAETRQVEMLEEASAIFRRFSGQSPVAFRAGCFAANRSTLRSLRRVGILLDTSFNPCYNEWSFANEALTPNEVCKMEGVWEVPVTVARTPLPEHSPQLKHADPSALSIAELRTMLESAAINGQRHFVIVFHSFSAVKPKDETYGDLRPDRIVIRRLKKLMKYLDAHRELYRVSTFSELARELSTLERGGAPVADLGIVSAGLRKLVQGVNRWYWL
jgi:hypothetical protein